MPAGATPMMAWGSSLSRTVWPIASVRPPKRCRQNPSARREIAGEHGDGAEDADNRGKGCHVGTRRLIQQAGERAAEHERESDADGQTDSREPDGVADDHRGNIARFGTERETDADLRRPHADRVRHDTVDTDRGEQERE